MTGTYDVRSLQGDSLFQYFREIGGYALLTAEEERELAERIGQGDMTARDTLVRANLRFVVTVARRYEGKGMSLADLICEGNVGLLRAAETFDGTRGFRFISYAVWWIRQAIWEALPYTRTVRLPLSRIAVLEQVKRASRRLEQEYGRRATVREILDETGMQEDQVEETLLMGRNTVSLDMPRQEGDERCLLDIVEDRHPSPEEEIASRMLGEDLENMVSSLGARQAEVLRRHFGLGGEEKSTLAEIGRRYGLTRERVRQIKNQGLRRLQHPSHRRRLTPYLEE